MQTSSITLILDAFAAPGEDAQEHLELPFEARQKARQRVRLRSGQHAGLKLPRGSLLRGGDVLCSPDGIRVAVSAAPESVSTVATTDPQLLARAAYHLGNRHVWVQVGAGWLRYLSDHVLDEMLGQLGLTVISGVAPFEPEGGAYAGHGEGHSHHHDSGSDAGHAHPHHAHPHQAHPQKEPHHPEQAGGG